MQQRRRKSKTYRPGQVSPAKPDPSAPPTTAIQRRSARLERERLASERPGARIEPTPEQLRRGTYATAKTKDPDTATSIEVRRNAAAPIDRWRARGQITPRQFDACDRYRSDYARGGYERSVVSRYEGGGGSGDGTPNMSGLLAATVAQIDAREQLRDARTEIPKRLAGYFDAIVLYEATPVDVGEDLGAAGNTRAMFAIFVIATCANILGDFYRIPE